VKTGDKVLKVWDVRTGKHLWDLKAEGKFLPDRVQFTPDGSRLITGAEYGTLVWDAQTGKELLTSLGGHYGVLSPDGAHLATSYNLASSFNMGSARIWNLRTGKEVVHVKGHSSYIQRMAFSPDGARLGTGHEDGTVKVWVVRSNQPLAGVVFMNVLGLAFSANPSRRRC
jgi:WD40 repeat protein